MKKYLIAPLFIIICIVSAVPINASPKNKHFVKYIVPAKKTIKNPAVQSRSGFKMKAGFAGGVGIASAGYYFPIANLEISMSAGFGAGSAYSFTGAQIEALYRINSDWLAGLSIDYANYSKDIGGLPGISNTILKGGHTGGGLSLVKKFGKIEAQWGFSSVFGVTACVNYKF